MHVYRQFFHDRLEFSPNFQLNFKYYHFSFLESGNNADNNEEIDIGLLMATTWLGLPSNELILTKESSIQHILLYIYLFFCIALTRYLRINVIK